MSSVWVSSCQVIICRGESYSRMFVCKGIVYPYVAEKRLDIFLKKGLDYLEIEA